MGCFQVCRRQGEFQEATELAQEYTPRKQGGWWLAPSWDFIQGPGAGGLVRPDGPRLMFMEQRAFAKIPGSKCLPSSWLPRNVKALKQQVTSIHHKRGVHESYTCHCGPGPICRNKARAKQVTLSGLFLTSYVPQGEKKC